MKNLDDPTTVHVTREVLYEQVWSVPLRSLARRYDLSDVGLAKACKRMIVPVPGRGYWAKKAAGKPIKQVPLPPLPPNATNVQRELQLGQRTNPEDKALPGGPEAVQAEFEGRPENLIVVSNSLRSPHPLVRKTMEALKGKARRDQGYVGNWREPHLDVQVSSDMLNRALRVMDALVKALEERGWKVVLGIHDDRKSYAHVFGQRVPFGIREKLKKVRNEPAKPIRTSTGELYAPYQSEYRDEPSGRLSLVLRNRWGSSVDKSWDDGASERIEDRLNEFLVAIVTRADEDREWDRRREEEERSRIEEEQRRLEAARRHEADAAREREFERQAENWQKSQRLAVFIAAARKAATDDLGGIESGSALDDWLRWGEEYALRLNPLSSLRSALPHAKLSSAP
jgi:hypothetical protein